MLRTIDYDVKLIQLLDFEERRRGFGIFIFFLCVLYITMARHIWIFVFAILHVTNSRDQDVYSEINKRI